MYTRMPIPRSFRPAPIRTIAARAVVRALWRHRGQSSCHFRNRKEAGIRSAEVQERFQLQDRGDLGEDEVAYVFRQQLFGHSCA